MYVYIYICIYIYIYIYIYEEFNTKTSIFLYNISTCLMKILKIIVNHENPSSYNQNGFMTSLALGN